jgi:DNA polymerase I-like protein with 3'-5' exonuclease and polymerase domains
VARTQKNIHIGGEQLPLIVPDSDWQPPAELPDLRGRVAQVALDTEGRDEGLAAGRGSSWPFRGGHICGVSAAWRQDGEVRSFYAPVRHPDTACMDPSVVARWVADHAAAGVQFTTHHGSHDWGWMRTEWGTHCPPKMGDTEAMAMLVDENRLTYRLGDLCRWRGVPGKDERLLREAAAAFGYGGDTKANLWRMPARFVGPYAEPDAASTLLLAESLQGEVGAQGLQAALQLELDLMPMVLEMRLQGVRVNLDYVAQKKQHLLAQRDRVLAELAGHLGHPVSMEVCRSPRHLEQLFIEQRVPIPARTEKTGQASFQASWMRKHPHWLPRLVARAEQLTEAADKFLQGFILDYAHRGRIHASINQYRGEEGGTRSFRFSYSDPALQQAPMRDEEMAEAFRGAFEPEEGEVWAACDYSQQEYRLIVHFATLLGLQKAQEAAQRYIDDPSTDFHSMVAEMTGLERKPAKDTNFAKAFGAGVPKFASMIGQSLEAAKAIMDQYDREMPFVRDLGRECSSLAERRGWVRLLDGARSHFDMWELSWRARDEATYFTPRPREAALAMVGGDATKLRRAHTHKAMNRLIQGSAARQTKMWMRECWRAGYLPLLQMHDELDFSVHNAEQVNHIAQMGRDVVQLRVPMKIDTELGPTWGLAKKSVDEVFPHE